MRGEMSEGINHRRMTCVCNFNSGSACLIVALADVDSETEHVRSRG